VSAPRVKIAVAGALGRMGRAILSVAANDPRVQVVAGWERPGQLNVGQDLGTAAGLAPLNVPLSSGPGDLAGVDAVIDFTAPAATLSNLGHALKSKSRPAIVVGTTGFEKAELAKLKAASRQLRVVLSSNYSVGVNLLWQALDLVARVTGDDYDVEVIEAHHHHKKDSPSGTAMTTAEVLARALNRDLDKWARYGRAKGNIGPRQVKEIGLHTVRGGDIVGDHTVLFAGPGERLELKHQAHSRENFARGSVRAALWAVDKKRKPGLYNMAQVLGFER
jgi:4-hydroxy-tetrahydrodipicolinate reductase